MKIISGENYSTLNNLHYHQHNSILYAIENWIKAEEPTWEFYRFGIAATGIFLQVSFAALMVGILGMAEASHWIYAIGIALAFMANSLAFANSRMPLLLGIFVVSVVVNLSLTLLYGLPLLFN